MISVPHTHVILSFPHRPIRVHSVSSGSTPLATSFRQLERLSSTLDTTGQDIDDDISVVEMISTHLCP